MLIFCWIIKIVYNEENYYVIVKLKIFFYYRIYYVNINYNFMVDYGFMLE